MSRGRDKKPRADSVLGPKRPVVGAQAGKVRRPVETPAGPERAARLRFRFDQIDLEGPWCLTNIQKEHHVDLLRRLRELESMTVFEVFNGNNAPGTDYGNVEACPNPALVRRLTEIGRDAIDGVSRIAINGKRRLYGIRTGHEFSILWWDPEHEIWPSRKKHT